MAFIVLEKDRRSEKVVVREVFGTRIQAEKWMEDAMNIWGEDRAYKIVDDENDS
jgi:hypothetical protein